MVLLLFLGLHVLLQLLHLAVELLDDLPLLHDQRLLLADEHRLRDAADLRALSLSLYIYIYVYHNTYVCIYIYIYM